MREDRPPGRPVVPFGGYSDDWPLHIGLVVLWFGSIEREIDSYIGLFGSSALRLKHQDDFLGSRAKRAKNLCLARSSDEQQRAEIESIFTELEAMIKEVRNFVAHGAPTFMISPRGSGQRLSFRRRGHPDVQHMTLDELKAQVLCTKGISERLGSMRSQLLTASDAPAAGLSD